MHDPMTRESVGPVEARKVVVAGWPVGATTAVAPPFSGRMVVPRVLGPLPAGLPLLGPLSAILPVGLPLLGPLSAILPAGLPLLGPLSAKLPVGLPLLGLLSAILPVGLPVLGLLSALLPVGLPLLGLLSAILPVLGLLTTAPPARADDKFSIDGQLRVRAEVDARTFDREDATRQYTDLRVRLGVKANLSDNGHAYVQLQDSRRFGGRSPEGAATSGTLNHGANVDVHQAYFQIHDFLSDSWGLKAGRFEVNLGNERVFGGVGWHNVGRSWEGLDTWYELDGARLEGMWLKAVERDSLAGNRDFDVFGLHASVPGPGLEISALFENDAKTASEPGALGSLERFDFIGYAKHGYERLDVETNLVYQTGTQERMSMVGISEDLDISAYLLALEVGSRLGERSRIAAGVDLASGDDDAADDKIETYDNLYYTGHKFRGAMDYFVPSSSAGLLDLMLRASTQPAEGWMLKGDVHLFRTAVEYVDFAGEETQDVGTEIDLLVSTTRIRGVQVELGGSAFFPTESFAAAEDPDPGLWFYTMLTAGF